MLKLLLGGSPCTHWSIAQTKNRETEPSGLGWELFLNYRIARDKYKPDYFLYENNKSMSPAIRTQITKELGVEPVLINSALVSAQNRQRLYWVGKRNPDGTYRQVRVEQPEDQGILLRDILESGVCWREKSYTLDANYYRTAGAYNPKKQHSYSRLMAAEPIRIGTIESKAKNADFDSQQYRIYSPDGKSVTLCGQGGGVGAKTGRYAVPVDLNCAMPITFNEAGQMRVEIEGRRHVIYEVRGGLITVKNEQYSINLADGFYIIRKLTVRECMRLQTVPEDYFFPVSDTQAYKMLGNGWTVDVIAHILRHFKGITTEPIEVLSMYDGMSCGHIALDKLGANVRKYYATETDKYAIKITQTNYPDTVQFGDAFQVRDENWDGWRIIRATEKEITMPEVYVKGEPRQHVLSLSYGKDSLACLGAIEQLGWPLDRIVHAEVWATDTIPADLPPVVEFKKEADAIIKERWGIEVEHFRAKESYETHFYRLRTQKAKSNPGVMYGWPLRHGNWCNSDLKMSALNKARAEKENVCYVGIAADEPSRFHNLIDTKKSPLVEAGWTEAQCRKWCEENGLLSPIYTTATRGGCWFCHNQSVNQLRLLRKNCREYWALMLKWDADSPVKFHPDGHTVHDYDRRFQMEDEHLLIPGDTRFKWSMLDEELNYRLF